MNSFISCNYSLSGITTFLLQGWLWYKITHECWYAINETKPHTHTHTHSTYIYIYIYIYIYRMLIKYVDNDTKFKGNKKVSNIKHGR